MQTLFEASIWIFPAQVLPRSQANNELFFHNCMCVFFPSLKVNSMYPTIEPLNYNNNGLFH